MRQSPYAATDGADAIALLTEWDAFRALDLERIKAVAKVPVMVDLRNVYDPGEMRGRLHYMSIGRA